mgnify:CR=1 FL=1
MNKIFLILVLIFIFKFFGIGQTPKKFKEISIEDFSNLWQFDNNQTVILQEKVYYYFDEWQQELRLFTEVQRRILVGANYNDYKALKINYLGKKNFEQIAQFQAYVYNLEGNSIKTTKLRAKDRKILKLNDELYQLYADFPNVHKGSIIEYRYTTASLNMVVPQTWYFQHKEPCLYSSARLIIPNFYGYQIKINDTIKLIKNIKSATYTNINFNYRYTDPIPSGINYRSKSFSTNINLSLQSVEYNFEMINIEPLEEENYIDNPNNYAKQMTCNLVYIDNKTGLVRWYEQFAWQEITKNIYKATKDNFPVAEYMPNRYEISNAGFIVYRVGDWQWFDAQMMRQSMFGLQLIRSLPIKHTLDSLFDSQQISDLQKAAIIFNYLTKNYKWNGQYSVFMSNDIDKIFRTKQGNSTDLNFILLKYLQAASVNASIVVVKTIDNGKTDYDWASPTQFNHSLALVQYNGQNYFFDLTSRQGKWYWLNEQNFNGQGRVVSANNSRFVDIMPNVKSVFSRQLLISNFEKTCQCSLSEKLTGIFAKSSIESNFQNINDFKNSFVEISNFVVEQKQFVDDTLSIFSCNFQTTDFLDNNKLYPFAIVELIDYLNQQVRQNPLFIKYPNSFVYEITVNKPKDKKLARNFEDFEFFNENSSISLKTTEDDQKFVFELHIDLKKYIYSTEEYYQLKEIHSKMKELLDYNLEIQ